MEQQLPDSILDKYRSNADLIRERMTRFDDQAKVPPDLVRSLLANEMTVELGRAQFTKEEELELLRRLEDWYADKGGFPNPEYLKRRRVSLGEGK